MFSYSWGTPAASVVWSSKSVSIAGLSIILGGFVLVGLSGCGPSNNTVVPTSPSSTTEVGDYLEDTDVSSSEPPAEIAIRRLDLIEDCDRLTEAGRFEEAISRYQSWLVGEPGDAEIIFRLAFVNAQFGDLSRAVDWLDTIPEDHPTAGLAALGQSADWNLALERFSEAEASYKKVLARVPDAVPALRQIAFLLNRQGRRQEASGYIRELCKLGDVQQDELHSLIAISDAMYDDPEEESNLQGTDRVLYLPIGESGIARKNFTDADYAGTLQRLRPLINEGSAPAELIALFGRAATESQLEGEVNWWRAQIVPEVQEFGDYWAAVGTIELTELRYDSAIGALAKAVRMNPTDLASITRLRQALGAIGKENDAVEWFNRWTLIKESIDANNEVASQSPPELASLERLISSLRSLDRNIEALMWNAIAVQRGGASAAKIESLQAEQAELKDSGRMFPSDAALWCGLDLHGYSIPSFSAIKKDTADNASSLTQVDLPKDSAIPPSFFDASEQLELRHTYRVASEPTSQRYAIYQTLGGGVAVLDYDLDGNPDLFLAQGGADAPDFLGEVSDRLFRNQLSTMTQVTKAAGATNRRYAIGVTSGDWNQDGFADIAVANIGGTLLMINRGDGTFSLQELSVDQSRDRVPSSIAIADLTGDALPEIYCAGYVEDETIATKPPVDQDGSVEITIAPGSFDAARDFLLEGQPLGAFQKRFVGTRYRPRPGLGLVIADFDGRLGCEVYVGNDSKPNRLWGKFRGDQPMDLAAALGCAYGFSGGETGAMGIAASDFNRDGALDLYVANYENEDANLYVRSGDAFKDLTRQYRLARPSRNLVGFGAQGIDFENDGDVDLVVSNGHLDDALSNRGTHAQPLQLYQNNARRFTLCEFGPSEGYCGKDHFGRSIARGDFNRDGLVDFVVTHVEEPTALLLNRTASGNHWLQISLVGISDERDAIGAKVTLVTDVATTTQWQIGGDGYLCKNEDSVFFGLGRCSGIEKLIVQWPSGEEQTFEDVPIDCCIQVTQSDPNIFQFAK